jgi:FixJ family two-component response regulator
MSVMRRHNVAVIDDDASVRTALVRLLRSVDFEALPFASARGFLDEFRDLRIDCVVLDLQMPEMTGLDLQRYLRLVYPHLALPVVMITAHDEPGTRERCLAAGVAAYVRKPVESALLLEEVRRLVHTEH